MGQGSGGSAASLMALSSEGRSATGVAALSGTPLSPGAVRQDPAKYAKELAIRTKCPEKPVESLVNCLRKMPAEKIVQVGHSKLLYLYAKYFEKIIFIFYFSGRFDHGYGQC